MSAEPELRKIMTRRDLEKVGIRWNNGVGGRLFPKHNYTVIYANGKTRYYGVGHEEAIPKDTLETFWQDHLSHRSRRGGCNQIIGVYAHSAKTTATSTRPIRDATYAQQ